MDAWNVLSRREDDHLSLLSSEFKHLNIGTTALSEVRRPDCGEIMVGGYPYYWFQGVSVAVSNKLTAMIIEATLVNEHIMRLRIRHFLGVISQVFVCAPTKVSDLTMNDRFYATLESVVDQCPRRDNLLVLEDDPELQSLPEYSVPQYRPQACWSNSEVAA